MLVETRKELRKEIEGLMSLCVAQTVDLDTLGDENAIKALATTAKIVNLYLTDMEEEAALLTEINEKLDKILK